MVTVAMSETYCGDGIRVPRGPLGGVRPLSLSSYVTTLLGGPTSGRVALGVRDRKSGEGDQTFWVKGSVNRHQGPEPRVNDELSYIEGGKIKL